MRVAIIGQGYVGTALGEAAHKSGHEIIGIEISQSRIETLCNSKYPISNDYSHISGSDVIVIAVPTPLNKKREPDLSAIASSCDAMKKFLKDKTLIVNESTSYPGTLRNFIAPRLGSTYLYASAPERVDPGNAIWGITNTTRVVGALNDEALNLALIFYRTITKNVIAVTSPEVAEAAKLFENTFRQVNIALVNEFAKITSALQIPTIETLEAAATKPYGFMKFVPSIGVGGHCIPIDPIYLSYKAREMGIDPKFIKLANDINIEMPNYVAEKLDQIYSVKGKKIQIAGIAYKPNLSDVREAPAIELLRILRNKGAIVNWHDELVRKMGDEKSSILETPDIGLVCTSHSGVDYSNWNNEKTIVINLSTDMTLPFKTFF